MRTIPFASLISRCAAALLLCVPWMARAAGGAVSGDFPAKAIHMIVGFPAGGSVDAAARVLGKNIGGRLGKPVVIENHPGFAGNIGAQLVAKSAADGYTLLMAALTTYSINATLMPATVGYDLQKDFVPIGVVGEMPLLVVVNSSLGINTLGELIALAKSKPNKLFYASTGVGSIEHVTAELFSTLTGVKMVHVPYKGGPPALNDVIGGQVDVMFATVPLVIGTGAAQNPKLKILAVTSAKRIDALPKVPTASEAGVNGFEAASVFGVLAPAGVPGPVVGRLNRELATAVASNEVRATFKVLGIEPKYTTPEVAARRIKDEIEKWRKVVKAAGIKPQ